MSSLGRGACAALCMLVGIACGGGSDSSDTGTTSATNTTGGTSAGPTTSADSDGTSTTNASTDDGPPVLDVGAMPDAGGGGVGAIPQTCAQAEQFETTVGCRFYALDLDNYTPWDTSQWGVAVANVQPSVSASVVVEVRNGNTWEAVAGPIDVAAKDLEVFELPDRHQEGSGVQTAGAYRITADVPVIAYQFDPIGSAMDVGWASADASLLHPAASWDDVHHVVGMISTSHLLPQQGAYVTVVAAHDGTEVTIDVSVPTVAGPGVPAAMPGAPIMVTLDEGDVVEVMTLTQGDALTGTRVISDEAHPVGVFTGHECANIPADVYACDHLEEQMPGLRRWGTQFVAARMPVRVAPPAAPETSLWQIYASEDDTQIELTASAAVTGLPPSPIVLQQGQSVEFYAGGSADDPGDFAISATKPIAVANYMTSQDSITDPSKTGDPAMVLLTPIEQFLPRYVVLVPAAWPVDVGVFTRRIGSTITIDGTAIDDADFVAVGPDHEVAQVPLDDGVHLLEGDQPFGVSIAGTHNTGSYAYVGGTATAIINPTPEG
jgi:hypothetical protein